VKEEDCINIHKIYTDMYNENISSVFPDVEIPMRIFLSIMVKNASGERSFSKLKFVKNELINRMTQPRLNSISSMCIENYILENFYFNIIHDFATLKCRNTLMSCSTRHKGTGTTSFV
jgi:hypothetical protein